LFPQYGLSCSRDVPQANDSEEQAGKMHTGLSTETSSDAYDSESLLTATKPEKVPDTMRERHLEAGTRRGIPAIRSDKLELEADDSCLLHWVSSPMTSKLSLIVVNQNAAL
jgi:hypothetical protein